MKSFGWATIIFNVIFLISLSLNKAKSAQDIIIDDDLAQTIVNQLNSGTNVTISTQTGTASSPSVTGEANTTNGDITVKSDIRVPASSNFAKLSFIADGNIVVEASNSADSIRIQNLQTGSSSSNGGHVFYFEAKKNITIDGIIDNFGGGDGDVVLKSTGPVTSGSFTIKGNININAKIDANKGGFVIDGYDVTLKNQTTSLLAGGEDVINNKVQITADNELKFHDGRLELFGDTDVLINAQKFNNLTGSNVFAVNAASADSVQWSIALPKLYDDNSNAIHTFGGLKSNNNANYNSTISTATNGDISISTLSIYKNQYHFGISTAISITANDDSKIYGDIADSAFEGISIATADLIDADIFGGVFTQDTVNSSINQSGLVLTSVNGAGADKNVSSNGYNITPTGLQSSNGYSFNYINGKLTVSRRAITLMASAQSKTYGDALNLGSTAFTIADKGDAQDSMLPNDEEVDAVTLVSANGLDVSTDSDVGSYTGNISITPTATGAATLTGSNGFDQENYNISYETGDLTINRRAITLIASGQEKIYGYVLKLDETAFTTLDLDGDTVLPNAEVITNASIRSATDKDASTTADVGIFENEIEILSPVVGRYGFRESNYNITYVPGDLTINRQIDTDNDGVVDLLDAFPNDATETVDTDGDGVGDNGDAFPNDATETVDTDGQSEAPVIANQSFTVLETAPKSTELGTLIATDSNNDSLTYSITSYSDPNASNNAFSIVGSKLVVNNPGNIDYESFTSTQIVVRVSDGALTADATITINVTDDRTEDSDGDGLTQAQEEDTYGTSDFDLDSDDDSYTDAQEVAAGKNPVDANSYPGDNQSNGETQTLNLKEGWNLVSFYVEANDMTTATVLAPIQDKLLQVKNLTQSYDPSNPSFLNTLSSLNVKDGYWLKVSEDVSLDVVGQVPSGASINVNSGWNLVGYPRLSGEAVANELTSLGNTVVQIKDLESSYDPNNPPFLNTLSTMAPGSGYWLNVDADGTWEVGTVVESQFKSFEAVNPQSDHSPEEKAGPSWGQAMVYPNLGATVLAKVSIQGKPVAKGGVVAAFVGNELRGLQDVVLDNGISYVTLNVNLNGAESVSYQVWNPEDHNEYLVSGTMLLETGSLYGKPELLELDAVTVVGKPLQLFNITSEPFGFSFNSTVGRSYTVEVTRDLQRWKPVELFQGSGGEIRFTAKPTFSNKPQFFRILVE